MKDLILLVILSGLVFSFFLVMLFLSFAKRTKLLYLITLFIFLCFLGLGGMTVFKFVNKSYDKVAETLRPRNGEEIYDALFGKRQSDCVSVVNYQDQIVPKIDYAIWLQFETCPNEVKRIVSRYKFTERKIFTADLDMKIHNNEYLDWFNPLILGDTILEYEYASIDRKNIQTIWTNLDSTKAFVRDVFD
jgi:hypothetical protein